MVKPFFLVLLLAVAVLPGCGSGSTSSLPANISTAVRRVDGSTETIYIHRGPVSAAHTRHVDVGRLRGLGEVLVNGEGHTLYAFVPGRHGVSGCSRACAAVWPPVRLTIEDALDAAPALDESLVTTEPNPQSHRTGDRVVKFAGLVLHTYAGDRSSGDAHGQGIRAGGGRWYVISGSGKPVTKTP
jgi:predicted lipoprotein with Yx(FWY)xxD motif